jgi:membrane carboxypeptidase/penicillin-binding protein PbpC
VDQGSCCQGGCRIESPALSDTLGGKLNYQKSLLSKINFPDATRRVEVVTLFGDTNAKRYGMNVRAKAKQAFVRILLGAACLLLVVILVVTLYYLNEIRVARNDTRSLFAAALNHHGATLRLSDLSPERRSMLLAVEDPAFTRHHGVDLATPGAGMTTLTQGLVKLLYFPDGFQPGLAKIRQTLIAQYALDEMVSKDDQLFLFLNICYLGSEHGHAIHGYENASIVYFGKGFSAITDDEFQSLVAMHIGPDDLKPGTAANSERVQRIRKYLSGHYQPAGLLDVDYNGKRHGSLAEESLMTILRLVTNARPE